MTAAITFAVCFVAFCIGAYIGDESRGRSERDRISRKLRALQADEATVELRKMGTDVHAERARLVAMARSQAFGEAASEVERERL
jgi:hypothetical protein